MLAAHQKLYVSTFTLSCEVPHANVNCSVASSGQNDYTTNHGAATRHTN